MASQSPQEDLGSKVVPCLPDDQHVPVSKEWQKVVAWIFAFTTLFDMVIAPVLWSIAQGMFEHGHVETEWVPLTLGANGIYYLCMGSILGVASWRNKD